MTAAQSLYRKFGALQLPLAESNETDLAALDPARDILLGLFAAALNSELAPVWDWPAQMTILQGSTPVQQKLPALPESEVLQQMKTGWPLLAVGRQERPATLSDFTLEQDALTDRWDIDYVLAPLTLENQLRMRDVLQAVTKIITATVRQGGHRAYRTDAQGFAANVFGDGENCCCFYSVRVTESVHGPARFVKDGPKYYAATVTLETVEVSDYLDGGDGESVPLVGATGTFGLAQSGDPAVIVKSP